MEGALFTFRKKHRDLFYSSEDQRRIREDSDEETELHVSEAEVVEEPVTAEMIEEAASVTFRTSFFSSGEKVAALHEK